MNLMTAASSLPAPTLPRMTAEEFLRLPDGGRGYELIDGELVERTVCAKSSRIGVLVSSWIQVWSEINLALWIVGSDASFRCFSDDPNRVRRADVAVIAFDRMTLEQYEDSGFITICPDLVVEVISPNDLASEVIRKRMDRLEVGVRMVWIVYPEDRSVHVYQSGARPLIYTAEDSLPGEPVLPGFAVPVADLFRLPTAS